MKELLKEFKQLSKKEKIGHFGVWLAILFTVKNPPFRAYF